jgi:hypothetical protein
MTRQEQDELARELRELRRVADQLDVLVTRVHAAADNAIRALNEGVASNGHQ